MNKEELRKVWERFAEKNDFMLNPDEKMVDFIQNSLLSIEESKGLKLCPCRLSDGTKQKNLELLCPCNFKSQEIWTKEGRCWCGLFVKRE